jgi:hypothetical protein
MASYSLVKRYENQRGASYPEMTWEPKEAFKAISDFFGRGHTKVKPKNFISGIKYSFIIASWKLLHRFALSSIPISGSKD